MSSQDRKFKIRSTMVAVLVFLVTSFSAMAAPTVTSKSPAANATWVSVYAPVTATFSEAMAPASITSNSFTLGEKIGAVAIAGGWFTTTVLRGNGTVVAWGVNNSVPTDLNGVVAIAGGEYHTVALRENGTVAAWGRSDEGQTTVPAGLPRVVGIAGGGWHTVALKEDGTVAAWGYNYYGQTTVPAGLTEVVAVTAGETCTVALKGDGTVVAWGDNSYAQGAVPPGLSGVAAVAAGGFHTVALKSDGTVVAWGYNAYGQTTIPAGLSDVTAIAAGWGHTVALKSDGTVVAWGMDDYGQATVPANLTGVVAIAAGGRNTLALKGDGTVIAWGDNSYGQTAVTPSSYFSSVSASVSYNAANRTATLTPTAPLSLQTVYRASVSGSSLAGIPMTQSASWDFSTGEFLTGFLVIPKAGLHGKISPAIGRLAIVGATANFTLTSDAGYMIDTVSGCGGSLVGNTYTTGPISQACNVKASFRLLPPAGVPPSIIVPVADADGAYTVSWGASTTAGVSYELQEATNSLFTSGLRTISVGTALSAGITGRSQNVTYYYRVRAVKTGYIASAYRAGSNGCAVPGTATVGTPAGLTVPLSDADGVYVVSWGTSATTGVAYVVQEATNSLFSTGLRTVYSGTGLTVSITGRSQNTTYYYRVKAIKAGMNDSAYRTTGSGAATGCAVPGSSAVGMPSSLTVPLDDLDGVYSVSWGASATANAIYELQEATSSNFATGLRTAYRGTARIANITGRSQNVTLYYRVRAVKAGLKDSGYCTAVSSCAVPGTATAGMPASLTVPPSDPDGVYTISWGASATAGVTYELQEATSSNFSTGLRLAFRGTAASCGITGRSQNTTYYYRVRAVKGGLRDSAYRGSNSCALPGTATTGVPASINVPASDPDGAYAVTWAASATTGATYEVQEATANTFTTGLRLVYRGTALTANITGRVAGTTYYYRVRAVKGGLKDSGYKFGGNGCRIGL